VADAAYRTGLRLGITTVPGRNRLDRSGLPRDPMFLRRVLVMESMVQDGSHRRFRAPFSIRTALDSLPLRRRS
jgi:hypothetical protein